MTSTPDRPAARQERSANPGEAPGKLTFGLVPRLWRCDDDVDRRMLCVGRECSAVNMFINFV